MADTANAPVATYPVSGQSKVKIVKWTLSGVSTGVPVNIGNWTDKTIQFFDGTWGSATAILEGSSDPTADPAHTDYASSTWGTLTDTTETAISATGDFGPVTVLQNVQWIRPKTTGGTGTTVYAILTGAKQ